MAITRRLTAVVVGVQEYLFLFDQAPHLLIDLHRILIGADAA